MSNYVSEAFAGFKIRSPPPPPRKVVSLPALLQQPENESPVHRRHYSLMADHVLPLTIRIQKEMRGRKFQEVQTKLQLAVEALKEFQAEEWPPSPASPPPEPEWMRDAGRQAEVEKNVLESAMELTKGSSNNTTFSDLLLEPPDGIESTTTKTTEVASSTEVTSNGVDKTQDQLPESKNTKPKTLPDTNQWLEDDPETNEPVHKAVMLALEAYILVLSHNSKTNKAVEACVQCVEILIRYHYVSGRVGVNAVGTSGESNGSVPLPAGTLPSSSSTTDKDSTVTTASTLLHQILDCVCKCSESNVDVIQLAVVKTLRSIMTSPKCAVHEASMLSAVRSTFHVYLITKTCKPAAKTALLDMLRFIFGRMEAHAAAIASSRTSIVKPKSELKSLHESSALLATESQDSNATTSASSSAASSLDGADPSGQAVTTAIVSASVSPPPNIMDLTMPSQYHRDAYFVFRSLCKLSSKPMPGEDASDKSSSTSSLFNMTNSQGTPDPLALNNKILSLELILAIMDFSGKSFCQSESSIQLVKNHLCVSLLKNCVSNQTLVAYLSQTIFIRVVYKFKAHLKPEIEVFLSNIFLRVLDSPNSSFKQKALVLESLRSLCKDPVLLTQIFLNYDCDFDAMNLYKEIVHNLTKLSGKSTITPSTSLSKKELEQEAELSLAGVEVLVTILKSFLKALGLPGGGNEDGADDGARIRNLLQIEISDVPTLPFDDFGIISPTTSAANGAEDPLSGSNSSHGTRATTASAAGGGPTSESARTENNSNVADKIVDAFEMKRNAQQTFELGMVKFTLSLKSGLKFFIDNGFVQPNAREVALFFLEHKDKLDKTQIGEGLGREPDAPLGKEDDPDPEKGGPGFWVRVLHHYVDAMDFTAMVFDDAIRLFLSGFRLPGEAQKIDRIMEKFAEHYTRQNVDIFPSADTAFILAFSVIMLNTDLHNPSIKPEKRMTLESFIRNNSGIAENGGNLPVEFLTGIFNRIQAKPFTLKEDDVAREKAKKEMMESSLFFDSSSFFGASAEDQKREKFQKEKEEMMSATEQLIRKRPGKNSKATSSNNLLDTVSPADVVKPMFDVTWGPIIGTLSQVLECSTDDRVIAVCLNGFVYAVRIACHCGMSLARDTFVNSLAKFTFLGSIKEMKRKNVESICTLLTIAIVDGEYLGECWLPVLQCLSQLARLRLAGSGLDTDESFLVDNDKRKKLNRTLSSRSESSNTDGSNVFRPPSKPESSRETEESNGKAVFAAVNEGLIDKVFSSTVSLSAQTLALFIEQLVAVSASEIAGNTKSGITGVGPQGKKSSFSKGEEGPSIFSLQRLVEVADFNMNVRPRLVWSKVWQIMADHFATIGRHENPMVSVFAIDSLKQLTFKFLDKPELSDFNFQRIFLRPFLQIIEDELTREDIRELVLRCVDNAVRTKSHNLQSGWKIFFSILTRSAYDPSERINTLGLAILQRLLDDHLHQLCRLSSGDGKEDGLSESGRGEELSALDRRTRNANVEDFLALCRASLAFVQRNNSNTTLPIGLSMRALCHTCIYADLLADHRVLPPVSGAQWNDSHAPGYTYEGLNDKESLEMVLWRPLLEGLAEGISCSAKSIAGGVGCLVQRGSVLALRAIVIRHGHLFSLSQWAVILQQTIIPSIQAAAEKDRSPVVAITSESPSISSLDFVADSLPLPPPPDDSGLKKLEELAKSEERVLRRPLGPAELLVEASFTDMRHGGDGNLSRAYVLAKKDVTSARSEQPFPDSWIATTSSIALGVLTDVASEIVLPYGAEGREKLWPLILNQYKLWYLGRLNNDSYNPSNWRPCEALVRAACRELHRFPQRVFSYIDKLDREEALAWVTTIWNIHSDLLSQSLAVQQEVQSELLTYKMIALGISDDSSPRTETRKKVTSELTTPYGKGKLIEQKTMQYEANGGGNVELVVNVVRLDFGGTLYCQATGSKSSFEKGPVENGNGQEVIPSAIARETYFVQFIPQLKIRCVAAHCMQLNIYDLLENLVPMADEAAVSSLMNVLNLSRDESAAAGKDEDLSHTFQEALFSEWGDGVDEVERALSSTGGKLSHHLGSDMFFLTQEASATNAVIHMLALLYRPTSKPDIVGWDRASFAEPFLLENMIVVLTKFLKSEETEGRSIDPNVWRNASESGGKVAMYCTSFAGVVVGILNVILELEPEQFASHKQQFFPIVCSLIRVQSEEIRLLVQSILIDHIGPLLGITTSA